MLNLRYSVQFKRDYKKALVRGLDPAKLIEVIRLLREEKVLPHRFKDHKLTDNRCYKDMRECHIQPNWLLIYQIRLEELILVLVRTGTHSDLFGK